MSRTRPCRPQPPRTPEVATNPCPRCRQPVPLVGGRRKAHLLPGGRLECGEWVTRLGYEVRL